MKDLPPIIPRQNLSHHWTYLDSEKKPIAILARYDEVGKKKRFHQYSIGEDGNWVEGAPTPSPIFGIDTVPKNHFEGFVYIFEGEKCAQAAHYLGLPALTSMMGSNQGHLADWVILANYRRVKTFVLVPDNDNPGKKYMQTVYEKVKKACPNADVMVCELPCNKKGDDFVN
ncbi:MAG: toprim domain-containing protein [Waddliaceae bacterium]